MAVTEISTSHALKVRQHDDEAFKEYLAKTYFKPWYSKSPNGLVVVKENLLKGKGDSDTIGLIQALTGAGVTGESTLEGNEEEMVLRDFTVTLELYRHAVRLKGPLTMRRTQFNLKEEARPLLTDWMAQKQDLKMFEALASIDGTVYASAGTTARNTWASNNRDRALYGATTTNLSGASYVHADALAQIDNTSDKLNTSQISLAKRMAQLAFPKIKPIMVNGKPWYVLVAHPYCTRDLKLDSTWINAQQYAQNRGNDNPLFTGALGEWDGVIVHEHENTQLLDNVGGSSIDVAMNSLLGAGALVYEQGGIPEEGSAQVVQREERFDYGNQWGCAIMSCWGHGKTVFNSKQHGVVSVFSAAVAD